MRNSLVYCGQICQVCCKLLVTRISYFIGLKPVCGHFQEGVPAPEGVCQPIILQSFLLKTAWKWKNLDCDGLYIPGAPLGLPLSTSENSKFGLRQPLVAILDQLWCFQPFWMSATNKNQINGCHGSMVQDRDLQWKLKTTKFGSIFNLLSAILEGSHRKTKWLLLLYHSR